MFLLFWVAYKILVHCDYFQVRKICLILWDLPLCSPVLSHTFLPITEAWSEGWLLSVREGERPTPAITARTLFKSRPTNVPPPFYIFWLGFRDAQRRPGKNWSIFEFSCGFPWFKVVRHRSQMPVKVVSAPKVQKVSLSSKLWPKTWWKSNWDQVNSTL